VQLLKQYINGGEGIRMRITAAGSILKIVSHG
jgi:hypothetical protein